MAQMCRFTVWRTHKDIYVNAALVRTIAATAKGGTEIRFIQGEMLTVREPVEEVFRVLFAAKDWQLHSGSRSRLVDAAGQWATVNHHPKPARAIGAQPRTTPAAPMNRPSKYDCMTSLSLFLCTAWKGQQTAQPSRSSVTSHTLRTCKVEYLEFGKMGGQRPRSRRPRGCTLTIGALTDLRKMSRG